MPETKYTVYVPAGFVPEVEAYCAEHDYSASEAFRKALIAEIEREEQ